jgi:UDP-galactopyranose mutase
MSENIILGAGLSGLSAAFHLQKNYRIYEKNNKAGGLCRSEKEGSYVFDYGPHILFPKYSHIKELIKSLLKENLHIQAREAWIYHKFCDKYTRFPFQAHLYGLPIPVVKECILGLFNAIQKDKNSTSPIKNYKEWILSIFGEGIAKHLMIPYANKLWTVPPKDMNFQWVKHRIPRPKIEDVLEGALSDNPRLFGFNTEFWYPYKGGIEALPLSFLNSAKNLSLSKTATYIHTQKKYVEFNGDEKIPYRNLISTIPLPEIIKLVDQAPDDVKKAAQDLKHNSVLCVNLGIEREKISNKHWIYFYEEDFCFHRISFPMNFSPYVAPEKKSSITTEISYSRYKSIHKENIIERAREDLIKSQILLPEDEIEASSVLDIPYAYIIYDHEHSKNVKKIHNFLRSHEIYPCGRFGEWEYFNMDDSIESGKKIAEEINIK